MASNDTNTTLTNQTSDVPKLASDDPVIFARFFYTGVVLYVVFNLILWPSLFLFLKRRHFFPVNNRFPGQVVTLNFVLFFWTTSLCFRLISPSNYYCGYVVWLEDTATVATLVLYGVRIMSLWVRFKVIGQTSTNFWNEELTSALKKLTLADYRKNSIMSTSSMSMSQASVAGTESDDERSNLFPQNLSSIGSLSPTSHIVASDDASWRRQSWFADRYWLLSPWFVGLFVSGILILCYLPFIYYTITIPSMMTWELFTCPRNYTITYVMGLEWIIIMIAMLVMGIKLLPEVKEALGMKTEIATVIPIAIGIILFGTIVAVTPGLGDSNRDVFPSFSFIIAIGNMPIVIVSTLIPALRSFPPKQKAADLESHSSSHRVSLLDVLSDVDSTNYFRKFLEKEFALENLMFYCETLEWKTKSDNHDPKVESSAVDIVKKFLIPGSLMEVNVPKVILNQKPLCDLISSIGPVAPAYGLLALLSNRPEQNSALRNDALNNQGRNLSPELFDAARHHVFELMENDSFRRFTASEDYTDMMKACKRMSSKSKNNSKGTSKIRIMKAPPVPVLRSSSTSTAHS